MPRDAAGRYDTANQRAAKARSAERRCCPKCNRKSALVSTPEDNFISRYCRWCDYVKVRAIWKS